MAFSRGKFTSAALGFDEFQFDRWWPHKLKGYLWGIDNNVILTLTSKQPWPCF